MNLLNLFNLNESLQPVEGNSCRVASLFQLPEHQFQVPENQSEERIDSFNPRTEAINTEAGANSSNPGTVAGADSKEVFNSWLEAGANPEEVSIGTELKSLAADPKALEEALKDPEALKEAINNALQQDPEAFKSIVKSLENNLSKVGEKAIKEEDLPTILNTIEIGTSIKNLKAKIPQEVSRAGANTEDATKAGANPEAGTEAVNPEAGTEAGGKVLVPEGGKATWYDPALGGINGNGDGITATGVRFDGNKLSAAGFPELLARLPREYTRPARGFRGGITLAKPVNLLVENTITGKKIILSLNDVGSGVAGHSPNHYLDLSPQASKELGGAENIGSGLRISIAPDNSKPGVIM